MFGIFGDLLIFVLVGAIIGVFIGLFFALAKLEELIEKKGGKKGLKAVRIMCLTLLIAVALFLGNKYVLKPYILHLHMRGETILSGPSGSPPEIINDLSYIKHVPSGVGASSESPPSSDGTCHDATMVMDDDVQTSWWEYDKGNGEGEWICLSYDSSVTVAAITIWSGRWTDESSWLSYDRPNSLTITTYKGNRVVGETDIECRDAAYITVILSKPIEIDSVRIMISKVDRGLNYSDGNASISEIAIYEKGTRSYISSSDMITDEAFEKMKNRAEDDYANHISETWGSGEKLQSMTFLGYYFLARKKQSAEKASNLLYMIYKCDVTCDGHPYSYYHFIRFSNLIIDSDGTCFVDTNKYYTSSHKLQTNYGYYYYGYESIDDLYNDCGLPKASAYQLENNVNE